MGKGGTVAVAVHLLHAVGTDVPRTAIGSAKAVPLVPVVTVVLYDSSAAW